MCDKGSAPCRLKVTHHNNAKIYGEFLASEMDMIPGENILPMGTCSVTGSTCAPDPIYWDKTNKGVKVNGYKLLFEDANLLCKKGGRVSVTFNVPAGFMNKLGNFGSDYDTGLGLAAQWLNYKDVIDYNQRGTIYDIENGKLSLIRDNSLSDRRRSGNYGEMKDNVYHRENDWRDIRKEHPNMNIDKNTKSGIDGAYEKEGIYRETDSKYGTSRLENTNNGKELSEPWTEEHLNEGAISNEKDRILMERANREGTLQREVIYTNKNEKGKIREGLSSETHDADGKKITRGQFETLEMKPQSKAAQFIDGTRSSIRNSKPLKVLANSDLAKGIQSSKGATKANNALWKATQFMESTPWLKTTGKVVGKGAVVVGIAMDAVSIVSAYQEEGEFGDKTQQATGSAVGGAAGAWAGAEIGALIGTAICPGIGTVIGGVLGGVIGGLAGSSVGSDLVDWLF